MMRFHFYRAALLVAAGTAIWLIQATAPDDGAAPGHVTAVAGAARSGAPVQAPPVPVADDPAGGDVHGCGVPGCDGHGRGPAVDGQASDEPMAIDPGWIATVAAARTGERVVVSPAAQTGWSGRVTDRVEHPDGRVSIGMRTDDGGTLFAVGIGGEWRARLTHAERREAWLLAGNEAGASMRRLDITELMCRRGVAAGHAAGLPPNDQFGPVSQAAPVVAGATPLLSSLPGANGVIYLDFDGETVSGTNWNSSYNGGADIIAAPSGYSDAQVQRVWKGMAEDYRPFNLNVTTDRAIYNATPSNRRTMVIFTPSYDWYGEAGGVAYIDIFGSSFYDEPAWVFTVWTGNEAGAAEAGAHEAGHTLGLRHDGEPGVEYYAGHGSGATSWAPIMGNSYSAVVTQWSKGEYVGATNTEDDLLIISGTRNGLGYRPDDHSDSRSGATPVTLPGGDSVEAGGVIETSGDIDVFLLQAAAGTVSLLAANDPTDPNLDIRLRLLDAGGTAVAVSDSLSTLDASLSVTVPGGTYFIEVEGVGTGDPDTGYTDYASLGAYTVTGTAPQSSQLIATILSPNEAAVSMPLGTGLVLEGVASGGAFGWNITQAPPSGTAVFSSPGALTTRCTFDAPGIYTVQLLADSGAETVEDSLIVSVEAAGEPRVYPNRGPAVDLGPDRGIYNVSAVLSPAVSDDDVPAPPALDYSWTILSGAASLSNTAIETPTLSFGAAGPVALRLVVFDGGIRCFDEVVLDGRFGSQMLLSASGQGRVRVPTDASLGSLWKLPGFDDSGWQAGQLGAGYDATKGNAARRLFRPLIGEGLDVQATMFEQQPGCYLRVPFDLTSAAAVLGLDLRMQYDDGFVAYLNGVEVARSNVPAGTPAWNSQAPVDRSDEAALSFETFRLSPAAGVLVDGANVLAIHGMNPGVSKQETNFVLVPELEAMIALLPFDSTVAAITDPLQRQADDDPDGDGWINLLEHAFGGNPQVADSLGYFELPLDLCPRLLMPESPPDDVRYEIERCASLGEPWTVVAGKSGPGDWSPGVPVGSVPADSNRVWLEFAPDPASRAFYRLRISLVAP